MFDFTRDDLMLMDDRDVLALAEDGVFYSAVLFPVAYSKLDEDEKKIANHSVDVIEEQQANRNLTVKWGRFVATTEPKNSDLVWVAITNNIYIPMHHTVIEDDPAKTYYEFI